MRVQLILVTMVICSGWEWGNGLRAQSVEADSSKIVLEDIEANFLSSYYVQEGNHSPVTGGIGTEQLTNFAPSFNVNIPLDTIRTLNIDLGVDFYSSASTDNIDNPYLDPSHVSGPSSSDQRTYVTAAMKKKPKKSMEYGYMLGTSLEWDVFSYYGGVNLGLSSKDNNRGVDLKLNYYFDDWKLIYPVEFRNGQVSYLDNSNRQTVNGSLILSANLHRRVSASLASDIVIQSGLLSTPFHRIFFADQDLPGIELLPNDRLKYPVGLRLNYHLTDFLIIKSFYRYYADSWGVTAHTFEVTTPLKVSASLRLYPFYRLLIQNETDYFDFYGEHLTSEEFYTSDFDLSTFDATKMGIGLTYSPLFGLSRFKIRKKTTMFKSFSLRYAHYSRTDGLTADVVTLGLQFKVKQK